MRIVLWYQNDLLITVVAVSYLTANIQGILMCGEKLHEDFTVGKRDNSA